MLTGAEEVVEEAELSVMVSGGLWLVKVFFTVKLREDEELS